MDMRAAARDVARQLARHAAQQPLLTHARAPPAAGDCAPGVCVAQRLAVVRRADGHHCCARFCECGGDDGGSDGGGGGTLYLCERHARVHACVPGVECARCATTDARGFRVCVLSGRVLRAATAHSFGDGAGAAAQPGDAAAPAPSARRGGATLAPLRRDYDGWERAYPDVLAGAWHLLYSEARAREDGRALERAEHAARRAVLAYAADARKAGGVPCLDACAQAHARAHATARRDFGAGALLLPEGAARRHAAHCAARCTYFYHALRRAARRVVAAAAADSDAHEVAARVLACAPADATPTLLDVLAHGVYADGSSNDDGGGGDAATVVVVLQQDALVRALYPESQTAEALGARQSVRTMVKKDVKRIMTLARDCGAPLTAGPALDEARVMYEHGLDVQAAFLAVAAPPPVS